VLERQVYGGVRKGQRATPPAPRATRRRRV